jgi:SAM-dependent methyltransferase
MEYDGRSVESALPAQRDALVRDILACPSCQSAVSAVDGRLECGSCGRSYPRSADGIPVLFPDGAEVSYSEGQALFERPRSALVRAAKAILTPPDLKVGDSLHDRLRDEYVFGAAPDAFILNFGSGIEHRVGARNIVNFDIFPHGNAHVVGDGHYLPFLDGSFDVVWLSAVLEHIRKPWLVADEVFRVLKPAGVVLVSVPFVQKRHGAPHDYFRYTVDGLRSLFDRFDELAAGPSHTGPAGTVVHVLGAWMNAAFPGKIGFGLEALVVRVMSWLKYADRLVSPQQLDAGVLSGGTCFLGRRP